MINDEHLTVLRRCNGARESQPREVTRLRHLASQKTHTHFDDDSSHLTNIGKAVSIRAERLVTRRSPDVRDSLNRDDLHQVR
jgi:hypothetical protein